MGRQRNRSFGGSPNGHLYQRAGASDLAIATAPEPRCEPGADTPSKNRYSVQGAPRLGALPPPQRKDLRRFPLARDQPHDAAAPELERNLNLRVVGRQVVGARHPIAAGGGETRL